jgi:hypothetical protein
METGEVASVGVEAAGGEVAAPGRRGGGDGEVRRQQLALGRGVEKGRWRRGREGAAGGEGPQVK